MITLLDDSNTIIFASDKIIRSIMKDLQVNIRIEVNEKVYIKNPETSELGRKIITGGIDLIAELGFEKFTFKKLAEQINSTEASIYRYFESKHLFLVYITFWYWGWLEYKLVFGIMNIKSAEERLLKAIKILTEQVREDAKFAHINEIKLYQIVISESLKLFFNKNVESDNVEGFFSPYKNILKRVNAIIMEINPNYTYPNMLVNTCIEGAKRQRFFANHLPSLTDQNHSDNDHIVNFYQELIKNQLELK